jgi:ketosteroid isomerase-like protein
MRGVHAWVVLPAALLAACTFAPPRHDPGLPGVPGSSSDAMRDPFVAMVLSVVRENFDSWAAAVRSEGPRPLHAHYAADAFVVQPGAGFLKGQEALRLFEGALSTRANDGNISMLDVEVSDGIAYVSGGYYFQPAIAGTTGSTGRHVTVLRRERADEWRIRTQLFAANAPAGPFPGVAESAEPTLIDVGLTSSGMPARDTFFSVVTLLASLTRAWSEDDLRSVAGMFAPNALLHVPGLETPARGAEVRAALEAALARFGAIQTLELDFTASGRLAVIAGRHQLEISEGEDRAGFYSLVLVRTDSDWKIRSLVLD